MTGELATQTALTILRQTFNPRRRGKIAHLPETIREQINLMLDDGVPYAEIIARLGEVGQGLNQSNLSRWRNADHQDWVREQRLKEAFRRWPDLAKTANAQEFFRLLYEIDNAIPKQNLTSDSAKVAPLLNTVARLTKAACITHGPEGSNVAQTSASEFTESPCAEVS